MKKINSIKFKNFKAFFGEETIQLDGKNLLIYGENGSGKSSIFWGLYTFLQSSTKSLADVNKYFVNFDENNPNTFDSLKNIFADQAEDAYIELETVTYTQTPGTTEYVRSGTITNRIDATPTANNKTLGNQHIGIANASSDFINYKLLHNFYNVTHKQEINLWEVFYKDVFPYYRVNENPNEPYFRERIDGLLAGVPISSGGAKRASGRPRSDFENKIQTLNNEINNFLYEIETNANNFLKEHFFDGKDYLQLHLAFPLSNRLNYNSIWLKNNDYRIIMSVELFDAIKGTYISIKRPHSFLNEALLTRLAISVRVGALMTRLQNRDYQILCLDDMLISLDMGNRDKVIQTFLNTQKKSTLQDFDKFQKLIFTHDKLFFEIVKQTTKSDKENWMYLEIYADNSTNITKPKIYNSKDYLASAKHYLANNAYEVAGNYLRKETELFCKRILPDRYKIGAYGQIKPLAELLKQIEIFLKDNNLTITQFNQLDIYRKFLLNDASHDSYDVPKYKNEIENAILLLEELKKIQVETVLIKNDKVFFELKHSNNVDVYHFEIIIQDEFKLIKIGNTNSILSKGLINFSIFQNTIKLPAQNPKDNFNHGIESLESMYLKNWNKSDKTLSNDFWEGIILSNSSLPLNSIRTF
jgi:energy-coupling factor transporter ATP-binding protein EcfA2